ncbi:hypothetical protein ACHAWF_011852 [Thalassiosira exigua]
MSWEMAGDVYSSSALTIGYLQRMREVAEENLENERKKAELLTFSENLRCEPFFVAFNNICRRAMGSVLVKMHEQTVGTKKGTAQGHR